MQSASVAKLFAVSPQPLYSKFSHLPVSGLKDHLSIVFSQCPCTNGSCSHGCSNTRQMYVNHAIILQHFSLVTSSHSGTLNMSGFRLLIQCRLCTRSLHTSKCFYWRLNEQEIEDVMPKFVLFRCTFCR
jgi:hypothetical protein